MSIAEKKKKVQVIKAKAAMAELELKIMEKEDEIERLNNHILKQVELIEEIESDNQE